MYFFGGGHRGMYFFCIIKGLKIGKIAVIFTVLSSIYFLSERGVFYKIQCRKAFEYFFGLY